MRMTEHTTPYAVHTGTKASRIAGILALILIVVLVALPAFASRSLIQDMFFILTMLVWRSSGTCLPAMAGLSRSASRPLSASAPTPCSAW
jgi:branched-chain amino acid transport system permease protein